MPNILISGSEGYVGNNIFKYLAHKFEGSLFAPGLSELDFRDRDAVVSYCRQDSISTLIHCASVPLVGKHYPTNLLEDNCRMFITVLSCLDIGVRLITFCSGSIFGRERWTSSMIEEEALRFVPLDTQGFSKFLFETIRRRSKNPYTSIRLFGLYGGEESYLYKFIPNTIVKALLSIPIVIAIDRKMSNTHVSDLGKFVSDLLGDHTLPNCDLNFGDSPVLLSEIAEIILTLIPDSRSSISVLSSGNGYAGNQSKFKKMFPDFKYLSLRAGIEIAVDHWRERLDDVDKGLLLKDDYIKSLTSGTLGLINPSLGS